MRGAVGAGGKVVRDAARAIAPRKSGNLRDGIRYTTSVKGTTQSTAKVFVSKKKSWYARLVEFGTLPHLIVGGKLARSKNRLARISVFGNARYQNRGAPSRAKALNILGRFVEKVNHPGAKPVPFMERAAESSYPSAVDAMANKLKDFFSNING